MRQILEKCWKQTTDIDTHYLFVDFETTCDGIRKEDIWTAMYKVGFPKELAEMRKIISKETHTLVTKLEEKHYSNSHERKV
jgi:hypothetical protein